MRPCYSPGRSNARPNDRPQGACGVNDSSDYVAVAGVRARPLPLVLAAAPTANPQQNNTAGNSAATPSAALGPNCCPGRRRWPVTAVRAAPPAPSHHVPQQRLALAVVLAAALRLRAGLDRWWGQFIKFGAKRLWSRSRACWQTWPG